MKTLKNIQRIIRRFSILLVLIVVLLPLPVLAQDNSGSIHIEQRDTDTKTPVSGVRLALYKIAEQNEDNTYKLTDDFQKIGIDTEALCDGEKYEKNVNSLDEYIEENKTAYIKEITSDSDGVINYTDLSDGIYFVKQNNSQEDFEKLGYTYKTDSFLVVLPWTNENGSLTRTVNCKPKGKIQYPEEDRSIVVYKVWKDENNKNGNRPSYITVGLYCDDKLQEEINLNAGNNWTHRWEHLNNDHNWKVEELNVPDGYSSEVMTDGKTYTITNEWAPENPQKTNQNVKTGDSTNISLYIVMMSGAIVMMVWIWIRKKNKR